MEWPFSSAIGADVRLGKDAQRLNNANRFSAIHLAEASEALP